MTVLSDVSDVSDMSDVAAWALAALAVVSGVWVFRYDSMARATFALLTSLLCVAGELILLGLDYLGVVIVLMMTIEMAIMAVFMIAYMMNPAGLMPMTMIHNRNGALAVSGAVFVLLTTGILLVRRPAREGRASADPTKALGTALMGPHMLTMMTLGCGLFATIVAVVVLATGRGRYDRYGDGLRSRPAADPVRGGVGR